MIFLKNILQQKGARLIAWLLNLIPNDTTSKTVIYVVGKVRFLKASDDVYKMRLDKCIACDQYDPMTSKCNICKCPMKAKAMVAGVRCSKIFDREW